MFKRRNGRALGRQEKRFLKPKKYFYKYSIKLLTSIKDCDSLIKVVQTMPKTVGAKAFSCGVSISPTEEKSLQY